MRGNFWVFFFSLTGFFSVSSREVPALVFSELLSGENAHRAAALGALLAANLATRGSSIPQTWKDGLNSAKLKISQTVTHRL